MSDQKTLVVQITDNHGGALPEAGTDDFVTATEEKLAQVANLVKTSCSGMAQNLLEIPNAPAEVAMEFGVDVGGEVGIPFVTKGTLNANFKVSVVWK